MKQIFFAQKALIVKDNRLLMIRKSKDEHPNPLKWDVPGGRIEYGEEINDSLVREIYEETGLRAIIGRPYYLRQWFIARESLEMQVIGVYRACACYDAIMTNANSTETEQIELIEWIPLDKVLELDLMPGMAEVMKEFIKDFKIGKLEFPILS